MRKEKRFRTEGFGVQEVRKFCGMNQYLKGKEILFWSVPVPLIGWPVPLILRGPAPYLRGPATLQNSNLFPYKYWFNPQFFLTFCTLNFLFLISISILQSFDHIYINLCFKVIQASSFLVQEKNTSIFLDKKYYNLL